MATHIVTAQVIDLNAAREARKARPFQGRLLKSIAAKMDPATLRAYRVAIAQGVANGKTTSEITRSILRDQVNQKAHAAL